MSQTNAMVYEWGTVSTLWRRDMLRLVRERSRWLGVIMQPLIFWLIMGSGMAQSFRIEGMEQVDYLQYMFPGILVMIVLFTTIFATISVIEDRQSGFLQGVLVGPASRTAMVVGKVAGVTTMVLIQTAVFVVLAPWAGYSLGDVAWLRLISAVITTSVGLTAVGFAMAWALDSVQAYHALMSALLLPLWILSGAMFPPQGNWVDAVMVVNPMSYSVSAVRGALEGAPVPDALGPAAELSQLVLLVFALATTAFAVYMCRRKRAQ